MNKKNYVQYKTDVVEFIRMQSYNVRVAILKKFEFIEYGLDPDWEAASGTYRQVIVELAEQNIVFECHVQFKAETGAIIVVFAAQKLKKEQDYVEQQAKNN